MEYGGRAMPFKLRCRFASAGDVFSVVKGPYEFGEYATREEAEAALAEAEREFRATTSPFEIGQGCLADLTSLPPDILCDWLRDAGAEPPEERTAEAWEEWWDENEVDW